MRVQREVWATSDISDWIQVLYNASQTMIYQSLVTARKFDFE